MSDNLRIILAGGGTGGHLMPGIALGRALRQRTDVGRVHLLHTNRSIDARLLSGTNLPHTTLSPPRWPGIGTGLVSFLPRLAGALRRYVRFFRDYKPDVVVGLGGYGCVPGGLAAALRGIPLVLMDQNVLPGRAARCLLPFSDLFVAQWSASRRFLRGGNIRVLGNPVRSSLEQTPQAANLKRDLGFDPDHQVLLVMGGSQGAAPLNDWVIENTHVLEEHSDRIAILHLAGSEHLEDVESAYAATSHLQYRVVGFTDEMERIYPAADLVLSRAGGTSLAELTYLEKPSVLVPYPRAMEDHQRLNARAAASTGGSIVVDQDDFSERTFRNQVISVLLDEDRREEMATRLNQLRRPDATERIASAVASMATS